VEGQLSILVTSIKLIACTQFTTLQHP